MISLPVVIAELVGRRVKERQERGSARGLLARRGHQRCHCNEEGFGTLSRQLGNDEGYRSSPAGVSGCFTR
jgi:hypothetical protein